VTALDTFAETLRDWQIFYSTVALASVTLTGLLFVSLSLRQDVIKGRRDSSLLRLARGSFADFLYLLMLGLVFLVPQQVPIGLAVALFALGAARGIGLVRQAFLLVRASPWQAGAAAVLREIALPLLASLGLLAVGIEVLRGEMVAMYALVLVVAALLTTASWNAWLILAKSDVQGN
jgi:hypothetical protein